MVKRGGGGKSQRTCAEDTKYREAGRKDAHLPQELGEKTRFVRRLGSYKSGRGRKERQTARACPELDPLSLRAETPDTYPKCPDRRVRELSPAPSEGPPL